jgi:hypothetical protein
VKQSNEEVVGEASVIVLKPMLTSVARLYRSRNMQRGEVAFDHICRSISHTKPIVRLSIA